LLTSKEIIERTGISRATLNNYIASGLVPRPQVLQPGPEHGAAPRIGYFPDDTVARIEVIQRLKREGWSISRIAQHFADPAAVGGMPPAPVAPSKPGRAEPIPAGPPAAAPAPATSFTVSLQDAGHPAYLVDNRFHVIWQNSKARYGELSPLKGAPGAGNVFQQVMAVPDAVRRDSMLRFHLEVALERSLADADLVRDLAASDAQHIQALLRDVRQRNRQPVGHADVAASGGQPGFVLYAVHFLEGVLFASGPEEVHSAASVRRTNEDRVPAITPVAILVATLQDASGLWVKLAAHDYFELVNEVWAALDPIFRRNHGLLGRHPDEGLVCYFLPQRDGNYLWNALATAAQARDAMAQLSRRWRQRQGWDADLSMNIGLDEGQEWLGSTGPAGQQELRVLGEAAERAEALSRCGRAGAILVTRSLLGKLGAAESRRVGYGVPQARVDGTVGLLPQSFARLGDLASPQPVPARMADLAVAELLDLQTAVPAVPPADAA
jgi:adenylate cyclase